MSFRRHSRLLAQAVTAWFAFWLLGLPAYYQQYSTIVQAIACVMLSVAISLMAVAVLRRGPATSRYRRAFWISLYYTVPFAILDGWYCGIYLGHGTSYLWKYWYLSVFYVTPWLTFLPTALLLNNALEKVDVRPSAELAR